MIQDKTEEYIKNSVFSQNIEHPHGNVTCKGLTKREYFAAMAMQGYISCGKANVISCKSLAIYSVQAADALIEELNK